MKTNKKNQKDYHQRNGKQDKIREKYSEVMHILTLNLLSCRTFLMATSSPESQSLA